MEEYVAELTRLIDTHCYWSNEVWNYNNMLLDKFGYVLYKRISDEARSRIK